MPLGLLHSSYAALRTVVDICASYTFYSSHPVEWVAVCEDRASWESRAHIINWHISYTPNCREMNKVFGWAEQLAEDYQELSSYVHGVPVAGLPTLQGIDRTQISEQDLERFSEVAEKTDRDLNLFLLSVFHQDLTSVSTTDFRRITKGIDRSRLAKAGIVLPRA